METSLKTGFPKFFSGTPKSGEPKNWGGGGGAAAPLAPPARMHIG